MCFFPYFLPLRVAPLLTSFFYKTPSPQRAFFLAFPPLGSSLPRLAGQKWLAMFPKNIYIVHLYYELFSWNWTILWPWTSTHPKAVSAPPSLALG